MKLSIRVPRENIKEHFYKFTSIFYIYLFIYLFIELGIKVRVKYRNKSSINYCKKYGTKFTFTIIPIINSLYIFIRSKSDTAQWEQRSNDKIRLKIKS